MNAVEPTTDFVENAARQPSPISAVMIEVLARYGLQEDAHVRSPISRCRPRRDPVRTRTTPLTSAALISATHQRLTA
jgi:hypothetical protein